MDRLRRSFRDSFRKKKESGVPDASKPHQWQNDETAVRAATCNFPIKYLGCVEVFESRGMQVCEEALKALRASRRRPVRGMLYVSGDGLRVVDDETKGLLVDQTIEKVSFCAPDRNHERGFSYICRDGTTRRWMCHGFVAVKETGERLSHAVGCAFAACLERKQKRDKECGVTMSYDTTNATFTRTGSFRQMSITERLSDPQECKPNGNRLTSPPDPLSPPTGGDKKAGSNPHAIARPHATPLMLQRQGSCRVFHHLNESSPFKRQLSLRLNDLPSNLERQRSHSLTGANIFENGGGSSGGDSDGNTNAACMTNGTYGISTSISAAAAASGFTNLGSSEGRVTAHYAASDAFNNNNNTAAATTTDANASSGNAVAMAGPMGVFAAQQQGLVSPPQDSPQRQRNRLQSLPDVRMSAIPEGSTVEPSSDAVSAMCQQLSQGLSLLTSTSASGAAGGQFLQGGPAPPPQGVFLARPRSPGPKTAMLLPSVEPIREEVPWSTTSASSAAVAAAADGVSAGEEWLAQLQPAATGRVNGTATGVRRNPPLSQLRANSLGAQHHHWTPPAAPAPAAAAPAVKQDSSSLISPPSAGPVVSIQAVAPQLQSLGPSTNFSSTLPNLTGQVPRNTRDPFDAEWASFRAGGPPAPPSGEPRVNTSNPFLATSPPAKAFEMQM